MRNLTIGLAFLLAAACSSSRGQAPAAWPAAPREFADVVDLNRVAEAFPNSANMQRRVLGAALQAGDSEAARRAAQRLADMGAGLSAAARDQSRASIGDEAMTEVSAMFDANVEPVSASKLERTIDARHRLIEGLVWEPVGRKLYASSVVDKQLLAIGERGQAEPTTIDDAGSLFGGAYDIKSKRIWLASAVIEQTPGGGFSGLIGVDTAGAAPKRIAAPAGATLGDVAIGPDGSIYASDGMNGDVYVCAPGCRALERLVPPGTFFSAQGLVASADGKLLYVADYRYGLAGIDLASRQPFPLVTERPVMLDGIDGLDRYGHDLIAIQNGSNPVRIIRLRLGRDGRAIKFAEVLERQSPDWGEPSLGRVVQDRFIYVANPQWERFGPGGAAKPGFPAESTRLRAISLR